VLVAVVTAAVARPVIHAAVVAVQEVLIVAGVTVGVGAAGLVGLLTWQWHRTQADVARAMSRCSPELARAAQPLRQPRPAIEHPAEAHLHLHGITAENLARILHSQDSP
jgi:hypothetical protein